MKKYYVNDKIFISKSGYAIGSNHIYSGVSNTFVGGYISSYSGSLDKEDDNICIADDFGTKKFVMVGDITNAYNILKKSFKYSKTRKFW